MFIHLLLNTNINGLGTLLQIYNFTGIFQQNTQITHYKQGLNYLYWQASACPSLGMIHITVLALRPLLISKSIPFLEQNDHPNHKINQRFKQSNFLFNLGFPFTDVTLQQSSYLMQKWK
jgi:hypothetical protein